MLVELNGLADPSQIIHTFWVDDGQGSLIELHQVVALVDAKSFAKKLESTAILSQADSGELTDKEESKYPENELLLRQIVYADKVLLNKVDLLGGSTEVLEEIREVIARVNPSAEINESTFAAVGLDFLLQRPETTVARGIEHEKHDCHHEHCLTHSSKVLQEIKSVYLTFEASSIVNVEAFEQYMGELLWESG